MLVGTQNTLNGTSKPRSFEQVSVMVISILKEINVSSECSHDTVVTIASQWLTHIDVIDWLIDSEAQIRL